MLKKQKSDDLFGIRIGVWLTVVGLLLLGVLPLSLLHRRNAWPPEQAAYGSPDLRPWSSATNPSASARPTAYNYVASDFGAESGRPSFVLTADAAATVACHLANEAARELYECEPFNELTRASTDGAGWVWSQRRAHGTGDIEAKVYLTADGAAQAVDVLLLPNSLY